VKQISTIGLDLAVNVFQINCDDADGSPILTRKLRRSEVHRFFEKLPPSLVDLEACGGSHYWGREIAALGHERALDPTNLCQAVRKAGQDRRR
jgi:transposase